METRYFSVEEANELLADIEPLMERLLERRTKVVESRQKIYQLLAAGNSDFGGPAASELAQDFMVIAMSWPLCCGYLRK